MPYHHFTREERYIVSHMALAGFSFREIGRHIGKHHGSISREIKRNRPAYADDAVYWYDAALFYEKERRHKARHHLRRRHKYRRRQKRSGSGRRFIPGRISIDQRPSIVDMRECFGDWEGDTLEGKKGSGGLATHVERKCRYLIAGKLPDKKAATMTRQSITSFRKTPRILRQTLPVDNGREFSNFKKLEKRTGLKVYFADPYAAWQRGTNENTNGLLRQYFPKGTDFRNIPEKDSAMVVKKLNNRPRKCLNYQTPHEVFSQTLRGAL
jgi:IS30 family transposase